MSSSKRRKTAPPPCSASATGYINPDGSLNLLGLTRADDVPLNLPEGVNRIEGYIALTANTAIGKYQQISINFPDCVGFQEIEGLSTEKCLNLAMAKSATGDNSLMASTIKFPCIKDIKIRMVDSASVQHYGDLDTASYVHAFVTERPTLTAKIDDMTKTDSSTVTIPTNNLWWMANGNDAMYMYSFQYFGSEGHLYGTPSNLAISGNPIQIREFEVNRVADYPGGFRMLQPTLYLYLKQNNMGLVGSTPPGQNQLRVIIDYTLSDVKVEELWLKMQNFGAMKPQQLQWSGVLGSNVNLLVNQGTFTEGAEMVPA